MTMKKFSVQKLILDEMINQHSLSTRYEFLHFHLITWPYYTLLCFISVSFQLSHLLASFGKLAMAGCWQALQEMQSSFFSVILMTMRFGDIQDCVHRPYPIMVTSIPCQITPFLRKCCPVSRIFFIFPPIRNHCGYDCLRHQKSQIPSLQMYYRQSQPIKLCYSFFR